MRHFSARMFSTRRQYIALLSKDVLNSEAINQVTYTLIILSLTFHSRSKRHINVNYASQMCSLVIGMCVCVNPAHVNVKSIRPAPKASHLRRSCNSVSSHISNLVMSSSQFVLSSAILSTKHASW